MTGAETTRRGFLSSCTIALLAVIGLLIAIPAIGFLWAPLRRRSGEENAGPGFVDVGPVATLPIDQWRLLSLALVHQDGWKATLVHHSVWVRRTGTSDDDIAVLSPICPHLGCPINWHPDHSEFVCPCHAGTFNAQGSCISGPPPRSMDPLEFQVRAGRLWVRWQDFKIGVAQRMPVKV